MSTLPISDKIKALSFKQPIAWLIAHGYLLVDDRSWGTSYQGSILIHASKGLYKDYYEYLITQTDVPIPSREHLEYGGVVGLAKLILCSKPENLPEHIRGEQRAQFSGVPRGHYGFLFADATPLPLMRCAGKLGLFELDVNQLLATPRAAQTELF